MPSSTITVTIRGSVFGPRNRVTETWAYTEPDGRVRVYDPVAGHYTCCHALTEAQCARIRAAKAGETVNL